MTFRDTHLALGAILLSLAVTVSNAEIFNGTAVVPDRQLCGIEGNGIYGLGVRTSAYLLGLSSIIAFAYEQESAWTIGVANTFFGAGMFIATLHNTRSNRDFGVAEAAIMIALSATCMAASSKLPRFASLANSNSQDLRLQLLVLFTALNMLGLLLETATMGYSVWYWFGGMDRLVRAAPCTAHGFFFFPVDLFGWFRTLMKLLYIVGFVWVAVALVLGCTAGLFGVFFYWAFHSTPESAPGTPTTTTASPEPEPTFHFAESEPLLQGHPLCARVLEDGEYDPELGSLVWLCGILQPLGRMSSALARLVFVVCSVECMIAWNRISGVNSVSSFGQLAPLLIGLGSVAGLFLCWENAAGPIRFVLEIPDSEGDVEWGNVRGNPRGSRQMQSFDVRRLKDGLSGLSGLFADAWRAR